MRTNSTRLVLGLGVIVGCLAMLGIAANGMRNFGPKYTWVSVSGGGFMIVDNESNIMYCYDAFGDSGRLTGTINLAKQTGQPEVRVEKVASKPIPADMPQPVVIQSETQNGQIQR